MSKMSTRILEVQSMKCPHDWIRSDDGDLGNRKDEHVCCPECWEKFNTERLKKEKRWVDWEDIDDDIRSGNWA